MPKRARRSEALTVILHKALFKAYNKEPLTQNEVQALADYFPEGYRFFTEAEVMHFVMTDPRKLDQGIVSVTKGIVNIHFRVGVR